MNGILERLLFMYQDSDYIIKLKARFLLRVSVTAILIFPFIIAYNIYLSLTKEAFGHTIYWPIIAPLLLVFMIYLIVILMIRKGSFFTAGHLFFIATQFLIWSIIYLDKSGTIERLDTIIILIGILSMSPLIIRRHPLIILVYSAITLLIAFIFLKFLAPEIILTSTEMSDFIGDLAIALVAVAVMTYNLFSISQTALDKSEENMIKLEAVNAEFEATNEDLTATNEELEAAMEELTATNEEFEAQNRELSSRRKSSASHSRKKPS